MTQPAPEPGSLQRLVQRHTGRTEPLSITEMPGGASTRRFYRVDLNPGSAVAMYVPDATRPEEIAKVEESSPQWPFLEVRELLERRGVRVPKLLAQDCEDGLILVEDLGDDTLAEVLQRAPEQREHLYQVAILDLARAQQSLSTLPPGCIIAARAFDRDLLRWELDHFREWGLEAQGVALTKAERQAYDRCADYLADEIASWPRGFVHRDYQSRNLMVVDGGGGTPELVWIDFQDALLGPQVYDLVALLHDSYQSLDRDFIEARLNEYAAHLGLSADERELVGQRFDLVTVQRKLKDAGRFVFIDRKKGDPGFLQFVRSTIGRATSALERLATVPQMVTFRHVLTPLLARLPESTASPVVEATAQREGPTLP